MGECVKF
jgi:5-oxoprolinase (ATP-hydrolysing)